jgi:hypothetical protein
LRSMQRAKLKFNRSKKQSAKKRARLRSFCWLRKLQRIRVLLRFLSTCIRPEEPTATNWKTVANRLMFIKL